MVWGGGLNLDVELREILRLREALLRVHRCGTENFWEVEVFFFGGGEEGEKEEGEKEDSAEGHAGVDSLCLCLSVLSLSLARCLVSPPSLFPPLSLPLLPLPLPQSPSLSKTISSCASRSPRGVSTSTSL